MKPDTRLLLIEDDAAQRLLLAAYLRQAGYEVVEADCAAQGRLAVRSRRPDLVLLDLNLPDGDGLELARDLRALDQPVIIVTSREEDRLRGLELGVDDFLAKPYHPRELVARVGNVLRRCGAHARASALPVGRFRLDGDRRELLDTGGQAVGLTRGEFDLLAELAQADGQVLSRAQLAEAINPAGESASFRSVDVLISRLRQKLEEDPAAPRLLLTVPGVGYRLHG